MTHTIRNKYKRLTFLLYFLRSQKVGKNHLADTMFCSDVGCPEHLADRGHQVTTTDCFITYIDLQTSKKWQTIKPQSFKLQINSFEKIKSGLKICTYIQSNNVFNLRFDCLPHFHVSTCNFHIFSSVSKISALF